MRSLSTCGLRRAAGFGLLACLATAPAAYAQGLTVGSLSGTPPGTAVVGAAGTTASGTCAYTGGASASTKAYNSVDEYAGQFTLNQGGSVTALTTYGYDNATFNGGASGFSITGGSVGILNHASAGLGSITGGTVTTIDEFGVPKCTLNVSGGMIETIKLQSALPYVFSGGTVAVSGGTIQSLTATAGTLSITGGNISSLTLKNQPAEHGYFQVPATTISGGSLGPLTVSGSLSKYDTGQPNLELDTVNLRGGTLGTLTAFNYGGFDVFGSNLQLTQAGYVTGFLFDGTTINSAYTNTDGLGFLEFNGTVVPAAVPEVSTTISLGLLLTLGLGGIALTKRRRQAA